ncbi:MAG: LacI family DNA-binding transcriptional regulator [Candidatus Limnocylindrales bacterium]
MPRRSTNRVTIGDVAQTAGVSVSTVSRVLRDHTDVGEETRAIVRAAIQALDYRPSPIARALVSGQSKLLALLVSDLTNPFYPQLAATIEREAEKSGYTVVICSTGDRPADTRRRLARLLDQGIDGIIHAAVGLDEKAVLTALSDLRRLVFVSRAPSHAEASAVVSDNAAGAAELTRHLLSGGHRRIGFIGGPDYARNAQDRLAGFRSAMQDVPGTTSLVHAGPFARETGEAAVRAWMELDDKPTAIIGINDSVAFGAMDELIRLGLRVPGDVALAGFDGTELAASRVVGLTSVDQHIEEMGRLAVQTLLRQLASSTFVTTRHVLQTSLLVRSSTVATLRATPIGPRTLAEAARQVAVPASADGDGLSAGTGQASRRDL